MEIKTLSETRELLNEFSQIGNSTPFHTFEWLSALETIRTKCEVAVFENDSAICPIFRKKMGPVEISFSPVFGTETAYLGLLSKDKKIDEKLKALKKEIGNFFMILPPGISTKFGSSESAKTIVTRLDKKNSEEHFKTVKKGHRYCVNKAEKDGVVVEEDYSEEGIDNYYNLLTTTYQTSKYKPLPKEFYKSVIQGLHAKDQIKVLFAKHNGKIIGCAAFPYSGKTVYYWTGASLKGQYASLYPNNAIQWHLIKWAYKQGLEKYDMLGASIEGIRNFKLGWGGELVDYTRVYSSTALKAAASAYEKLGASIKEKIRGGVR